MKRQGEPRALSLVARERRVGLVIRVSTDMQASNDEGSLTTQLQRLRQHIQYKNGGEERWQEVAVYELRAVSGKDSVRSVEFEKLYADVRAGRVNTVMFTALSRLCRSVRDFLTFVEFLQEHGANFVSMKEDYDTTSAHGRLIMTIVMALAEFEREQTSERTKDAFTARAERGLWNGGRILGYDLDPARKGYLLPNPDETAIIGFIFDTYLECGSIALTTEQVNARGFRTKSYMSRRRVEHEGKPFGTTTIQHILKSPAYIGKKAIEGGGRVVEAVWPAIIDSETFERAQALMKANGQTRRSGAVAVRHAHVLNRGLLVCGRCQAPMQGRSGTGKEGKVYFYYACTNRECGLRVVAQEIEGAVIERLSALADSPDIVDRLVEVTNARRAREIAALEKLLRLHRRTQTRLAAEAARLLARDDLLSSAGSGFVTDQMAALSRRREETNDAIATAEEDLGALRKAEITPDGVRVGLANFYRVYRHLKPFEQQELIRLLLRRAEVGDHQIVLEVYEMACLAFGEAPDGASRFGPTVWYPGQDSNLRPGA